MTWHRPRKRFGQHFLHEAGVIDRILQSIRPRPEEHFIEIGPGEGVLTLPLLEACGRLDAVELDRDLAAQLTRELGGAEDLHIHNLDALRFDPCSVTQARVRVVGNLPYNISTPLLFHLFDHLDCITDMTFMLQKEVVDRMAAAPGGKTYGRLSVMVQYHCQVEPLFVIRPGAFNPPPKVDSALVRLTPYRPPPVTAADPERFTRLVQHAFSQRRKILRNSLAGLADGPAFAAAGIDPVRRAETLSVAEYVGLANQPGPA